jgi:ABC-type glycerol-3-phosphate transport system substrate-binding protein
VVRGPGDGGLTRAAVLSTGATALLAACGLPGQATESGSSSRPAGPVEIEYWSTLRANQPEGKGRLEALKLSEQANADQVRVRYEQEGGSDTEKLIAAVSAGTPPNLIVFRPNNAAQLVDLGAAVEMESLLKTIPAWPKVRQTLRPTFLDGASWRGRQVSLPLYQVTAAMMYAPEHLEKVGAPPPPMTWTWADFEAIARRAARPPDVWGLDIGWDNTGFEKWTGSNGVRTVDKDQTKVSFVQPAAVEAIEFLANLTHGLQLVPPTSQGELLIKGQTVFEPQGAYRMPVLREAGVRFEPIDFPRGPQHKAAPYKLGSMYSFIVFKSSDPAKQQAAARVALGCLMDDAQTAMCKVHLGLPATTTAADSSAYKQYLAQDRQMKAFVDMSPSFQVRPSFPSVEEMWKNVDQAMGKVYRREDSIRNALLEAERQTQRLLDADHARKS